MRRWWDPEVHRDRRPRLLLRSRIVAAIRAWFAERDFVEVDPAALQVSPGNETHLHAFATEATSPGGERRPFRLHTSPEFALKKLLAAGEPRPFAITHVFRDRERGALHHPEFTMLEWYRAAEDYGAVAEDAVALVRLACAEASRSSLTFRGRACDPAAEPERLAVLDAFDRLAEVDLAATMSASGEPDPEALRAACRAAAIRVANDDTWSDMFSRVLVERIEPRLGIGRPTVLELYPVEEAALARRSPRDPRLAERFELYLCGVEIANGFGELTDPAEQRRRFEAAERERKRVYGERYPLDEDFLQALATMPPASGVALGLDRVVMLAAGAERVEEVIWTPVAG